MPRANRSRQWLRSTRSAGVIRCCSCAPDALRARHALYASWASLGVRARPIRGVRDPPVPPRSPSVVIRARPRPRGLPAVAACPRSRPARGRGRGPPNAGRALRPVHGSAASGLNATRARFDAWARVPSVLNAGRSMLSSGRLTTAVPRSYRSLGVQQPGPGAGSGTGRARTNTIIRGEVRRASRGRRPGCGRASGPPGR
jgi:hypothetical protein